MPELDRVQVGVIGLDIDFHFIDPNTDAAVDLTGVASIQGRFQSPSAIAAGTAADTVTLTVTGNATLGVARYTTLSVDDIDEAGDWKAQGIAQFDADHVYPSEVVRFNAKANLPIT